LWGYWEVVEGASEGGISQEKRGMKETSRVVNEAGRWVPADPEGTVEGVF